MDMLKHTIPLVFIISTFQTGCHFEPVLDGEWVSDCRPPLEMTSTTTEPESESTTEPETPETEAIEGVVTPIQEVALLAEREDETVVMCDGSILVQILSESGTEGLDFEGPAEMGTVFSVPVDALVLDVKCITVRFETIWDFVILHRLA